MDKNNFLLSVVYRQLSIVHFISMTSTRILSLGFFLAALAVILGAFGAHSLKQHVSPQQLDVFKTGVQYQFYHAIGIVCIGFLAQLFSNLRRLDIPMYLFLAGIICFSGSLYAFTFEEAMNITKSSWIGVITPLGGAFFISGWIVLAIKTIKN